MTAVLQHRVVRHGLFWAAVSAFFVLIQLPDVMLMGRELYWREYVVGQLPLLLLATYPLVYWLLPRLLSGKRLPFNLALLAGWLLGCKLLSGGLWALYTYSIAPVLFQQGPAIPFRWAEVTGTVHFGFLMVMFVGAGASAAKVFHSWHGQQLLSQRLLQRKLHAELELLKAQLQPDFLFQTLGSLRTLTEYKSPDSPGAVLKFSALLRYLLYESKQEAVPLVDEVEMIRHYAALEKLRLGSQVEISLAVSGLLHQHQIAPLLLLPIVENAFHLGTAATVECPWVSIDLVAKSNSLTFKVINSRSGSESEAPDESGLKRLRQRLKRLYPGRHQLKTVAEPDTFLVALHLQTVPLSPFRAVKSSTVSSLLPA
jgi:hypothetical protein